MNEVCSVLHCKIKDYIFIDVKCHCLYDCLLAGLQKIIQPIFTKFGEKVANGSRKKTLDFGDNPDRVNVSS